MPALISCRPSLVDQIQAATDRGFDLLQPFYRLSCSPQQSFDRRVISRHGALEEIGDAACRLDNDGATELQGIALERTGQHPCLERQKTLLKRFDADNTGQAVFKSQQLIGAERWVGQQCAPVAGNGPEFC